MISVEEWEKRAISLQKEIEESLGNIEFKEIEVEDEDLLLLESLNSKAGKYLLDDISLSDLDEFDLDGVIDIGEDLELEKIPLKWPASYSSLSLQLSKLDALSSSPTSFWLEIGIPGLEPIRSRISKPKAKYALQKSTAIGLDIIHNISLDIPVESTITFKLFAIGATSGIPTRSAKSNLQSQELWVGVGALAIKDILLSPEHKISQTLMLSKEKLNSFKPANVLAQIYYELALVPSKKPVEDKITQNVIETPQIPKEETTQTQPPALHEPIYLNLSLTTLDSISFPQNCDIIWAKFKLTAEDAEIITPTVSILGFLEPRFDYKLNRPIPWSVLERMKYPIIIEIHSSDCLIGLVKVPIHNIAKSFMECRKVVGLEESFAIVDVISGEGRGFLHCGIRIGENEIMPLPPHLPLSPLRNHSELQPGLEAVVEEEVDHYTAKQEDYENVSSSDSVLQITIHKATGLASLIESLIPSSAYSDILLLSLDHTPNVYITIDLFGEGDSDSVTSPIVSSFAPSFGYKVEVTVECVDVELVNFLRSGKALGRVWHRVPRHLQSLASEVLLGSFEIEMADLLKGGIRKRWVGVKNEDKELAGVCLSMSFEGYEVGVCPSVTTTFECKYDMQLQGLDGYVNYTADGLMRDGKLPYQSDQIEFENNDLEVNVYNTQDVFLGTGFIGLASIVQKARNQFRKTQTAVFNESMKLQIINTDSHEWLGLYLTASINVYVTRRRRDRSFQRSFLTDPFKDSYIAERESLRDISKIDIVDADYEFKADLDQDSITKAIDKVEKDIYQILPPSKLASKVTPKKVEVQKEEAPSIPLVITIEKATNLPLMQDPLASSLQSPFVKISETKTALANASCSFTLPDILGGGTFQSIVVQAQSNPVFNFSTTTKLTSTKLVLDKIKNMILEIQIYHHLPLSFTSSNSFISDLEMELVGKVKVDLGILYSMDEIYGWYDVLDEHECCGQVLVRISPERDLSSLYKELDTEKRLDKDKKLDDSVVLEEVFEWDGSEWVAKMILRPKFKAKSIEIKQKGNLSLENALEGFYDLHSNMIERFKGLGLGVPVVGNDGEGSEMDGKADDTSLSILDHEISVYHEEVPANEDGLPPVTRDERSLDEIPINSSNPFLDNEQSLSKLQSDFMNSVEHSDLPLHGEQYLFDEGLEEMGDNLNDDFADKLEPENNSDSFSRLLLSSLNKPSRPEDLNQVLGEEEIGDDLNQELEEDVESDSNSDSFSHLLLSSKLNLPSSMMDSKPADTPVPESDNNSFNGKLSISKLKPPLPPAGNLAGIRYKELPPRQGITAAKSEIEKRLENLSIERSRRIAKILRNK